MEKIVTGYEKFCQLKELVKSEALVLMVGIDIGKKRHTACIRVRGQVVIKNFSFENTRAGFERLEEKVEQVSKKSAELIETIYGVESTGNYHKPLAYYLKKRSADVVFVSTLAVRRDRETIDVSWDKNDRKDAENIADLVSQGKFFYYDIDEGVYADSRRLIRHYMSLQEEQRKLKIKLRNDVLSLIFPELDGLFADMGSKLLRKILSQTPYPGQIRRQTAEEFTNGLNGFGRSREKIGHVYKAAGESIGIELEKESMWLELNYLLERYEQLEQEIGRVRGKYTRV